MVVWLCPMCGEEIDREEDEHGDGLAEEYSDVPCRKCRDEEGVF